MQTDHHANRLAVDEYGLAEVLPVSLSFLRKDRQGRRLLPFYRVGRRVLYNVDRVREALATLEEGGPAVPAKSRSRAA